MQLEPSLGRVVAHSSIVCHTYKRHISELRMCGSAAQPVSDLISLIMYVPRPTMNSRHALLDLTILPWRQERR